MTPATAERDAQATPQHMIALRRANQVRLARAELKRHVGEGSVSVTDVVSRVPWEAASMTISELLTSQPHWGTTRTSRFLAKFGVPETKTVGSFTERQRNLFASLLD